MRERRWRVVASAITALLSLHFRAAAADALLDDACLSTTDAEQVRAAFLV